MIPTPLYKGMDKLVDVFDGVDIFCYLFIPEWGKFV